MLQVTMDDDVEELGVPLALLEGLLTSHNLFGSAGKIGSLWHEGDVDRMNGGSPAGPVLHAGDMEDEEGWTDGAQTRRNPDT